MSRGLSHSSKQPHLVILENLIAVALAIRIKKLAQYLIIIIFINTRALCNCCVVCIIVGSLRNC